MGKTFNLVSDNIEALTIIENRDGNSCRIEAQGFQGYINTFKLTENPKTNTFCDVTFFRSTSEAKFKPRLVLYKIEDDSVKETSKNKIRIDLSESNNGLDTFWDLISFLKSYKDLVDTGDFEERFSVNINTKILRNLKSIKLAGKIEILKEVLSGDDFQGQDIEEIIKSNRKQSLEIFDNLLNKEFINKYRLKHDIKESGDEAVWHHFLKVNKWILGLNADYRFYIDLLDEQSVGQPTSINTGNPKVDLIPINDYTVLVELKTANTDIFKQKKTSKSRANTWDFSIELIEGISQCLAQKVAIDETYKSKDFINDDGKLIDKRAVRNQDVKSILIIGNKEKEFSSSSKNQDDIIKRDTFERFRRNNRNITVITFDELYEKASYIVNGFPNEIV